MKKLDILSLVIGLNLAICYTSFAQKGIGTQQPSKAAALEIAATNKGILVPKVALQNTKIFTPLTGETEPQKRNAILVYNTATVTGTDGVFPGFYYWTQSDATNGVWNRLMASNDAVTLLGVVTGANTNTVIAPNTVNSNAIANSSILNEDIAPTAAIDVAKLDAGAEGQVVKTISNVPTWVNDLVEPFSVNSNEIFLTNASDYSKIYFLGGTSFATIGPKSIFLPQKNGAFLVGDFTVINLNSIGNHSISMGYRSFSSGFAASTYGFQNTTAGSHAVTFGRDTKAPSYAEAAFGSQNTNYSVASGGNTAWRATDRVFSVGANSTATPNELTLLKNGNLGLSVDAPTARLDIQGQIRITGGNPGAGKYLTSDANGLATWGTLPPNPNEDIFTTNSTSIHLLNSANVTKNFLIGGAAGTSYSAGTKMLFIPSKGGAFRAGSFTAENLTNIGVSSTALGTQNTASADYSFATGTQNKATGTASTVTGYLNTSSGNYSFAAGYANTAPSVAETVLGSLATLYTPAGNADTWNNADRLFTVGNGNPTTGVRSNALVLLKNGNLTIAGTLTQASDKRLKQNIVPLANTLEKVLKLNPVAYDKKTRLSDTQYLNHEIGFIAQEVEEVFPLLVKTSTDADHIKSVNYAGLVPVLTQAIQEQYKQWDGASLQQNHQLETIHDAQKQLQQEFSTLKSQNETLESQLQKMKQNKAITQN